MSQLKTKFIENAAVTDAKVATGINATKIGAGSVSNTAFGFISGLTSDAQTQINGKLSSALTSAHIFVGNGSNVATDVPVSGDLSLANTGALTINSLAVTNAKIANTTIDLTTKVTGSLPIANGGTGQATASAAFGALSPLTTKGDLLGFSTVNARVPVGTNGFVLTADSSTALGVSWQASGGSFANTALSNLVSTSINQDLLPDGNGTRHLGSSSFAWTNSYIAMLLDATGTASVDSYGRVLSDGVNPSLEWANRQLLDNSAVTFDWSTTATLKAFANLQIQPVGGVAQIVSFFDDAADFAVRMKAPSVLAADTHFVLPPDDGTNDFVLKTDGTGVTSWASVSSLSAVNNKETFVLNGTDITNQYVDLAHVAKTSSINFLVKGAPSLLEGASYDYSVNYTGGAGGNTRITFLNDLATGGGAALVAGDVVQVMYEY